MYALFVFVLLFACVLIAGAVLAYPVYTLLSLVLEPDFERVANRTVLGLGILTLLALFRKFGFRSWQDVGFPAGGAQFFKDGLYGFGAGLLIMGPVVAGLLLSQDRVLDLQWDWSLPSVAVLLVTALVSGAAVALIEETFFRGALLTAVLRQGTVSLAVISTSFFYALVHFLQPEMHMDPDTLNWTSGFALLLDAFAFLSSPLQVFDSFLALFVAGLLLALVRVRSNHLALCIGMHAGWVFAIKAFKRVTNSNDDSAYAFLAGTYDQVIGYLAVVFLVFAIALYLGISRPAGEKTGMG
ncbi:MAG: CPBP family intramembrane metalloprotease [Gammaproteobacteria bacterium]|nr:CPBP family intramembrane metalloprotease [Gammaproteobacteria bacterium]